MRVIACQPPGLTKFKVWTNQNSEIYEQALERLPIAIHIKLISVTFPIKKYLKHDSEKILNEALMLLKVIFACYDAYCRAKVAFSFKIFTRISVSCVILEELI